MLFLEIHISDRKLRPGRALACIITIKQRE